MGTVTGVPGTPVEQRDKNVQSDIILAKKKVTDLRRFPNPNIVNLKITH